MRFTDAIELFVRDKRSEGRINSARTEESYRSRLECHAQDIGNRDPRNTGREDVKRTLRRWEHPNTQANARAILVSFYRWSVQEGMRKDNPAEQTRPPKKRKPTVYRMTRAEVIRLMRACETHRERRVIYLGVLTGARNEELRGLQRRHFEREGAVWISKDIAKGGRERFIPVLSELDEVVGEILERVGPDDFVIPGRRSVGGRTPDVYREMPARPCSPQAVGKLVADVGLRAGISAHIHPHLLRHAFGDHVARMAGIRAAQALLGHADISTTESTYTGGVTLDELTSAVSFFRYEGYPLEEHAEIPVEAPSGLEPEDSTSGEPTQATEGDG